MKKIAFLNKLYVSSVYLQEARVGPDRQVKLWCVCDEQDIAVYVNGRSDWPEEQGEDVTWLVWGNNDGRAEVLHLKEKEEKVMSYWSLCIYHISQIRAASVNSFWWQSTLNMVLASSGRDTLCIRMAKLKAFVRKMGLSTGSTGLSLMWNNVAVWSKPK